MTAAAMIVTHDIFIAAVPEKVWQTITSQDGMKAWLGPQTYEPRLGGKIDFRTTYGGDLYIFGEIKTFDPPNTLAFTWTEQEVGGEPWPVPTLVTIKLTAEQHGTRVSLQHSGFEDLPTSIARQQFEGYKKGWAQLHDLDKLKAMIEEV